MIRKLNKTSCKYLAKLEAAVSRKRSGCFTCGGNLEQAKAVRLLYQQSSANTWSAVELPASSASGLDGLVSACTPAGFGIGSKLVHDETYRRALQLSIDSVATTFALEEHRILPQIQRLLMPGSVDVSAELYKLNVYETGGFFDAHVDTPRGDGMFGSLVVCLPSPHTGGELALTHDSMTVEHSWGEASATHLQWAAFYSDCTHTVRPVTSGRRITLTYNLYAREAAAPAVVDERTLPIHGELQMMLKDRQAMPEGATLGFGCAHLYAHNSGKFGPKDLKGVDAALYAAADALGLKVSIEPVWVPNQDYLEEYAVEHRMIGGKLGVRHSEAVAGECSEVEMLEEVAGGELRTEESVIWVRDPKPRFQRLGVVLGHYGNEPSTQAFYHMAAILVEVPPSKDR